jgi:teneurin
VNWSYQTSKACTVLVGESTEMFSASKATTIESTNKSLARPHQSSTSSGSGKGDEHSRPRRSVDGHASSLSPSVSSMDSSTTVVMHELITTPSVSTVSLVHGVTSDSTRGIGEHGPAEEDGSGTNEASVSSNVTNRGELIVNNTKLETSSHNNSNLHTEETSSASTTTQKYEKPNITLNKIIKNSTNNINPKSGIELPVEIPHVTGTKEPKKEKNIAYDPESMQSDAIIPSRYSYGIQKLQYLKLLARLNEVNDDLHISLNDSSDTNNDLNRLHYDSDNESPEEKANSTPLITAKTDPITTSSVEPITAPVTPITSTTSSTTQSTISPSMNFMTTHINSVPATTHSTLSVTNSNLLINNTNKPTEATIVNEDATVQMPSETKYPDGSSNPKHVLINLTISADGADNASYKPLYSLTVTVPTVGNTKDIPFVKITPMDAEPTAPTNFNNPVAAENTTTLKPFNHDIEPKQIDKEIDWGGTCECSCPVCESDDSSSDDFYSDYSGKSTTEATETGSTSDKNDISNSSEYSNTVSLNTEISDITTDLPTSEDMSTENTESSSDFTTESDLQSTSSTTVPECICPKVKLPPILILEGEVVGFE